MVSSPRARLLFVLTTCSMLVAACGSRGLLGNKYEYEEELRLNVDGSARMDLSSSVAALVALRGFDLDPATDVDRSRVRSMFEGPGVIVRSVRVSRRDGRQFVHVRLDVEDIRRLSRVAPFSWSKYQFDRHGESLEYKQQVGAAVAKAVGDVGWNGNELVAFRMHIPSVITFHNAPSKKVQRGNILEWEQPFVDRMKGLPVDVRVDMTPDSILYSTLLLFGSTIVLAAAVFGVVVWRVARHGRDEIAPARNSHA